MAIQKRATGLYARVVVPGDLVGSLRRRELVRSLRTARLSDARPRALSFELNCGKLFAHIRRDRSKMTADRIDQLTRSYLASALDEAEKSVAAETDADGRDELASRINAELHRRHGALAAGDYAEVVQLAARMLADAGATADPESAEFRRLCKRLMEARQLAQHAELRMLNGELVERPRLPVSEPAKSGALAPLLSAVGAEYISFRAEENSNARRAGGLAR